MIVGESSGGGAEELRHMVREQPQQERAHPTYSYGGILACKLVAPVLLGRNVISGDPPALPVPNSSPSMIGYQYQ
jgi:hypothetical protein